MAVVPAELVAVLQRRSSGFDIHVVDDGRTERLVEAMTDARRRIYRIRHPEEPEDPAVNWVGGPSVFGGVVQLVVDLKDCAEVIDQVVGSVVEALDDADLDDALIGTSVAAERTPTVPTPSRGCPAMDALAEALEGLARGDPDAVLPPVAAVAADCAASRRRLFALQDLAVGDWTARDLDAVGLGEHARELRRLPPLLVADHVAPAPHLAALGEALVATRALEATLRYREVVDLERHWAWSRSLWGPILRVATRYQTPSCTQFAGAHPGPAAELLWSWAAANLVSAALDQVGYAASRAGGNNTWYQRDLEDRWTPAGKVAAAILCGGEPVSIIVQITGLEGDGAVAAIAQDELWRELALNVALFAVADSCYRIGERSSHAIAVQAYPDGAEATEQAVRSHLRGHGRGAVRFMETHRDD